MNRFKRFGALILALLLVAAPCVSVLAANEFDKGSIENKEEGLNPIAFYIKMKNANDYTGSRPEDTFMYQYERMVYNSGPQLHLKTDDGGELDQMTFQASPDGSEDLKSMPLYIDADELTTTTDGTYGYYIYQAISNEHSDKGFSIINGIMEEGDDERVQSMYQYNTSGGYYNRYELYLNIKGNKVIQAVLKNENGDKVDGFIIEYKNPSNPTNTYSVALHKTTNTNVKGTFTFDVKVELPESVDPAAFNISVGGSSIASTDFTGIDAKSATTSVKIAVGETAQITGLPDGAKVYVREHDDGTYLVSSSIVNLSNAHIKTETSSQDTAFLTYGTINKQDGEITYINDTKEISLTGVSLRYAPFLAMAAVALFGFALSRRRVEDEI